MTWFTFNALADDGSTQAMYIECDTPQQAQMALNECHIDTDDAGVSEMIMAVPDRRSN